MRLNVKTKERTNVLHVQTCFTDTCMKINKKTRLATSKANLAPKKGKDKAKVEKPEVELPETINVPMGKFIVIGSPGRGTAFMLTLPTSVEIGERYLPLEKNHLPDSFGATSAERAKRAVDMHSNGKPCGIPWVDSMSWLAPRGEKFTCLPLQKAIASKLVSKVKATISRDGMKPKQVTLYVHGKCNLKAEKLPHSIACLDVKSGRVETRLVNDGRNSSIVYKVKLAK